MSEETAPLRDQAGPTPGGQGSLLRPDAPILAPGHTYASVTDHISAIVLTGRTPRGWYIGFGLAFALVIVLGWAAILVLVSVYIKRSGTEELV